MKKVVLFLMLIMVSNEFIFSQVTHNSLNFDGINDYVVLDTIAPVLSNDSSFTIEFNMKADKTTQTLQRVVLFGINPAPFTQDNRFLIVFGGTGSTNDGKIILYDNTDPTEDLVSSVDVGDNVCHHIAYVRTGNIGELFIDGVSAGTHTNSLIQIATDRYTIGQEWDDLNPSQFYKGELDELRIWNYSRTQLQITSSMSIGLSGSEAGLVAYYPFNQGVSGGSNTGINVLTDITSNGHDGALSGFALSGSTSNWVASECVSEIGIESEEASQWNIKIYPNPVVDFFTLASEIENFHGELKLLDSYGKRILEGKFDGTQKIDISLMPAGVYHLIVVVNNHQTVYRIIKS